MRRAMRLSRVECDRSGAGWLGGSTPGEDACCRRYAGRGGRFPANSLTHVVECATVLCQGKNGQAHRFEHGVVMASTDDARALTDLVTDQVWATSAAGWAWYRLFVRSPETDPPIKGGLGYMHDIIHWSLLTSFSLGVSRMISKDKGDVTYHTLLDMIPDLPAPPKLAELSQTFRYERLARKMRVSATSDELMSTIAEDWVKQRLKLEHAINRFSKHVKPVRIFRNKVVAHLDKSHATQRREIKGLETERIRRVNIAFSRIGHDLISMLTETSIEIGSRHGYESADDLMNKVRDHHDLRKLQDWAMHTKDDSLVASVTHWFRTCGLPPGWDTNLPEFVDRPPPPYKAWRLTPPA